MIKRFYRLIAVLLALGLAVAPALSETSASYLQTLKDDELLSLWRGAAERLRTIGEYPFIDLETGDEGEDVMQLQIKLGQLGFYSGGNTGVYDSLTAQAVADYEKEQGLTVDGAATAGEQRRMFSQSASGEQAASVPSAELSRRTGDMLLITQIQPITRRDGKTVRITVKNRTKDLTIDAITIAYQLYDAYGELLSSDIFNNSGIIYLDWWKNCNIKPGGSFVMKDDEWIVTAADDCASLAVALSKFHTTDGTTYEIPRTEMVWVPGRFVK